VVRRALVSIAPWTIPNGAADAARGKELEKKLSRMIAEQRGSFAQEPATAGAR
jgi:hypothetical protein